MRGSIGARERQRRIKVIWVQRVLALQVTDPVKLGPALANLRNGLLHDSFVRRPALVSVEKFKRVIAALLIDIALGEPVSRVGIIGGKLECLLERNLGFRPHLPVSVEAGLHRAELAKNLSGGRIVAELGGVQQLVTQCFPVSPVARDRSIHERRDRFGIEFKNQTVRFQIRIHPRKHIITLDVVGVPVFIALKNLTRD